MSEKVLVSIIAAMDRNRLIGNKNRLPWHLPADLAHFKRVTMGKPVIMGRKTFESIGRALPGRTNIIITRSGDFHADGVVQAHSLQQALGLVSDQDEAMIIGGGSIYQQALPLADRLYLTYVENRFEGDAWFPDFDIDQWQVIDEERYAADEKNASDYRFVTYQRKKFKNN